MANSEPCLKHMVTRVAINGFGTIGKRVADAVDAQDDMEIVGVTKTRPSFDVICGEKEFPLFVHLILKKKSMHSQRQVMTVKVACQIYFQFVM